MIGFQAAFLKQLLNIPQRQGIAKVPADRTCLTTIIVFAEHRGPTCWQVSVDVADHPSVEAIGLAE
jgi:hypothetical protein